MGESDRLSERFGERGWGRVRGWMKVRGWVRLRGTGVTDGWTDIGKDRHKP